MKEFRYFGKLFEVFCGRIIESVYKTAVQVYI